MILGHGIDLINQNRIKEILRRYGRRFEEKYFSENEIISAAQRNRRVSDYAKCWASKEAFSKALGTGIRDGLFMKDISLERNRLGKPQIYLNSRSRERVDKIFHKSLSFDIHISITDDFPWVQASVIICENTKVNNYSLP